MANTSSAKKAIRSSARKKKVNDLVREKYKQAIKEFESAVANKEKKSKLEELLQTAYKQIDKAAKPIVNVISQNKAARLKSRLSKKLN